MPDAAVAASKPPNNPRANPVGIHHSMLLSKAFIC